MWGEEKESLTSIQLAIGNYFKTGTFSLSFDTTSSLQCLCLHTLVAGKICYIFFIVSLPSPFLY